MQNSCNCFTRAIQSLVRLAAIVGKVGRVGDDNLKSKTVKIDDKPRLSGGTFYILVLQALKQRVKAREHYKGERDGLSDPEVLVGLIRVINPDYIEPKDGLPGWKANDFKSCKTSHGEYLPFGATQEVATFDERVRTRYGEALLAMTAFVEAFLEYGKAPQKEILLVKALIELIEEDSSISDEQSFYISEDGRQIKKTAFSDLHEVCLPAFLLGIWHFIVVNRKDNSVGKATYDYWCPSHGNAPRPYQGNMGKRITRTIRVTMPDSDVEIVEDDVDDMDEQHEESSDNERQESKQEERSGQQIVNNPLFIQQNGDGNAVIPNYGTINLTIGGKRGGSDE